MVASTPFVDKALSERRSDLPALTGMRFIAAILVFMTHVAVPFMSFAPEARPPSSPFRDEGLTADVAYWITGAGMAMPFFFMLSGFVITWSSRPGQRATAFWRRRLVRVFPNHIVTWALAMLLFASAYTPAMGLSHLFLVNTWSTDFRFWLGANPQAWSLCAELLFYALFPLLLLLIWRIPAKHLWAWAGAMVAGMYAVCLITLHLLPAPGPDGQPSLLQFWFIYFFPPVRMLESFLGMLLARIVMAGRWPRIGFIPVLLLLGVAYYATVKVPMPYNLTLVPAIPLALAIGTFAAANVRGNRTVLGTRPMVFLGNISFGFYMIQGIVLYWFHPEVLGYDRYGVLGGIALILGLTVLNTVAAWGLFKLVEQPMMKRWARARRKPAAQPAEAER